VLLEDPLLPEGSLALGDTPANRSLQDQWLAIFPLPNALESMRLAQGPDATLVAQQTREPGRGTSFPTINHPLR
jgi:hypothetical protein